MDKKQLAREIVERFGPQAQSLSLDEVFVRVTLDLVDVEIELVWQGDRKCWEPMVSVKSTVAGRLGVELTLKMVDALIQGARVAFEAESMLREWLTKRWLDEVRTSQSSRNSDKT